MGTPIPEMEAAAESASAEALLSSLKTIEAAERRRHATVFNYWLSIRKDRAFPPIRDLDPLEISDAGPQSVLLEMVGGGEDADIRHIGGSIRGGADFEKICDAPARSLLSCIGTKLPIVAATRDALAFEEEFEGDDGPARCWVTLLPFSAGGTLIDYVYGFVTLEQPEAAEDEPAEPEAAADEKAPVDAEPEAAVEVVPAKAEPEVVPEEAVVDEEDELVLEESDELLLDQPEAPADSIEEDDGGPSRPGFSGRFSEKLKNVAGFYGRVADLDLGKWKVEDGEPDEPAEEIAEPVDEIEPAGDEVFIEPADEAADADPLDEAEAIEEFEPEDTDSAEAESVEETADAGEAEAVVDEPDYSGEGTLQSKLAEVRAKADEARQAKLRANAALYEGLSAAYDFALDAEDAPEEYLKLVEGQGLKIQLRSPMKPVVKLAFDGLCDDSTIGQLEGVLAWALKQDLPRGSLAEHIQSEGGIAGVLGKVNGQAS